MARVRHSTAYDGLASLAGEQVGLADTSPVTVAKDPEAAAARGELWREYESMLRDTQTYTLEAIRRWLTEQGCDVSLSCVQRDRNALLANERSIVAAASRAKAVMDMVNSEGGTDSDIFAAGRAKAGQLLFEALCEVNPDALANLTAGNIIKLVGVLGDLSRNDAQVGLVKKQTAELQRKFDAAVAATQAANKGTGKTATLTAEQIAEIRRATFGEVA